ncbi:hypothetical protein [uncultured Arthrobacter sp.]|uniref:hypothetical protein n=1 Tax=uncultured Arthrobacter sp. TaxID=114050 RepID=UPI0026032726|nr:hypothetical protein [uncultured Arthrobacter sp.]
MIEHDTARVRSYAQIDADCRLERFDAVVSAREAHRARVHVEIIAFPQAGLLPIMDRPSDRTVIHRGRVVAADQLGLTPLS